MTALHLCLIFSTLLFATGLAAALARGNAILVLLGIELMLNAANINFIAFWRYSPQAADNPHAGVLFTIFSIAVAAAEAAVGLALIIAVYRHQKNIRLQDADKLKG
ncbi:MAG: NADH-quinone oxidoreductase subunit NuoK [Opitutaceae bacterium]|jgi:NADH-quinone oxidoreductase subunit K|nr:NADH-quinone oxidoreductase subunit NuoK [Opitutaceae bacterium]